MVRVAEPVANYMIAIKEGDLTGKVSSKIYGKIECSGLQCDNINVYCFRQLYTKM